MLSTNLSFSRQPDYYLGKMLLGRSRYQWAHEPGIFAVKGSPKFHTEDRTKTTVWDFGGYDKSKISTQLKSQPSSLKKR
jgi:hypothetical protein